MLWLSVHWVAYTIGILYSAVIGYFMVTLLHRALWNRLYRSRAIPIEDAHGQPDRWMPPVVGVIERTLYAVSYLLGHAEFIGLWLVLKVAGQWGRWNEGIEVKVGERQEHLPGRSIYYVFLCGTAASLAHGVLGAIIAQLLVNSALHPDNLFEALYAGLSLIAFTLLIALWAYWIPKKKMERAS
ncbi:hypothetical protein J7J84_04975 [bacterium]|nr:hypothetical protein [bacterium]